MPTLPPGLRTLTGQVEFVIDRNGAVRQAGAEHGGEFIETVRRECERSLFLFGKIVMGYDLLTATLHKPLCDTLQKSPPWRKLVLLPRGHLKTTILKALALHALIQPGTPEKREGRFANVYFPHGVGSHPARGTNTRILLASRGADLARSTLGEIISLIEGNALLRAFWPNAFWDEPRRQARYWNQERIILPRDITDKEASIETIGVGGQITGYHFNIHIFDDLVDINDANSPTQMQTAIDWWKASRALMDDPDKTLEFTVGTRWAVADLYDYIMKRDPTVEPIVRRVVEDGTPIFPERFSLDTVLRLQRELDTMFPLLYMNSATDPTLTDFDMTKVRPYLVSDGKLVYDEDVRDALAAERRALATTVAAGRAVAPPRGQRRAAIRGVSDYDSVVGRAAYLRARHVRSD